MWDSTGFCRCDGNITWPVDILVLPNLSLLTQNIDISTFNFEDIQIQTKPSLLSLLFCQKQHILHSISTFTCDIMILRTNTSSCLFWEWSALNLICAGWVLENQGSPAALEEEEEVCDPSPGLERLMLKGLNGGHRSAGWLIRLCPGACRYSPQFVKW